jgi:hypothetical protein
LVPAILILVSAWWFIRAELFGPLADRLQSRSQGIVERRGFLRSRPPQRRLNLALATFALGMVMFALFFGLIAACDRL